MYNVVYGMCDGETMWYMECAVERRWRRYITMVERKVIEEVLYSIIGREGWRFRVWSEGSWPFHGLWC